MAAVVAAQGGGGVRVLGDKDVRMKERERDGDLVVFVCFYVCGVEGDYTQTNQPAPKAQK